MSAPAIGTRPPAVDSYTVPERLTAVSTYPSNHVGIPGRGTTACGGTTDGPEGKESVPPQPESPVRSSRRLNRCPNAARPVRRMKHLLLVEREAVAKHCVQEECGGKRIARPRTISGSMGGRSWL